MTIDQKLYSAAREFVIRVLGGACTPQETAVLPEIMKLLIENENTASS